MKARDKIDSHHNQDAFHRAREIAEEQDTGVVLLPRRQIKVGEREDLRHHGPPWSSESECAWTEDDFQLGKKKKGDQIEVFWNGGRRTVVFRASQPVKSDSNSTFFFLRSN